MTALIRLVVTSIPSVPANYEWFKRKARATWRVAALLVGFTIPLQTTPAELVLLLFISHCLLTGDFRDKWQAVWQNRIALLASGLFALLATGVAYSTATGSESGWVLFKYRELLYVPLFAMVFQDAWLRVQGVRAFMAGALVLLTLSYVEFFSGADFGLQSTINQGAEASAGYVVYKDRIIHNLLMSFLAYWLALEFMKGVRFRWLYAAAFVATIVNIVFLVQGRTGYLTLGVLSVLFVCQHFRPRGIVVGCALLAATGVLSYVGSPIIRARVDTTLVQIQNHFGPDRKRSPDPRLEFYESTLGLIGKHPWIGSGTGSFAREYEQLAKARGLPATVDPHCEYLLIAVQVGLPGLGLFLALLWSQWTCAARLNVNDARLARGMVLMMASGCLFNSLILGFTGGLFLGYFSGLLYAALSQHPLLDHGICGRRLLTNSSPLTTSRAA